MPIDSLHRLFTDTFSQPPLSMKELSASGSNRRYFRMLGKGFTIIGAYNKDLKENQAFIGFSKHFHSQGFAVPEVLAEDANNYIYLLSDLGDETLYSYRSKFNEFTPELIQTYKEALNNLLAFQTRGSHGLDYSLCYPRNAFDRQSIYWDLNYFKYYFLKLAHISFDEQLLENDFEHFTNFLLEADADFFLFRDFQSRNIMLHDNKLFFIDYQGGRKGALPYDVASLLYDGKAAIPQKIREELLTYYIQELTQAKVWMLLCFANTIMHLCWYVLCKRWALTATAGFTNAKNISCKAYLLPLKICNGYSKMYSFPYNCPVYGKCLSSLFNRTNYNRSNKLN